MKRDTSFHFVFAERFDGSAVQRARSIGNATVLDACDEDTLTSAVRNCDALLIRSAARVTRRVMEGAERLRVIGRAGVGLDNIDLETARERGIAVVYTPFAATEAVADLTVALILAMVRRVSLGDAMIRSGKFLEARRHCIGSELSELTLGIVGLGRIGRSVARRCRNGFGMSIVYHDIAEIGHLDFVAKAVERNLLYHQADVISLHVPLTRRTRHLIDEDALSRFKGGSLLINTSRGAVVDGDALAAALHAGKLAGAALDVFDPEPLPQDHPLMSAPNTLFTPHIGARVPSALKRMNAVIDDVIRVLQNKQPICPDSIIP